LQPSHGRNAKRHQSPAPIFLCLSSHRLAGRILHLEAVGRATRAVRRVLPIGHDPLQPHLAGMAEHDLPSSQVIGDRIACNTARVLLQCMSQELCQNVWPGRAVQDGLSRSTNVRAASMYQALKWSILLRAIMGIRAHPRLATGKTSKGQIGTQSRGCAGQTVRCAA
jgi:hypothetical protein